MSRIQFDVLVPHAQSKQVGEVFEEALKRLVTAQRIDSAEVNINDTPRLPEGMEEQLRQTYRDEHDGHDLVDAGVYRYLIKLEGVKGSLNEDRKSTRLNSSHVAISYAVSRLKQ